MLSRSRERPAQVRRTGGALREGWTGCSCAGSCSDRPTPLLSGARGVVHELIHSTRCGGDSPLVTAYSPMGADSASVRLRTDGSATEIYTTIMWANELAGKV